MANFVREIEQILSEGGKMFHVKHFENLVEKFGYYLEELKSWNQKFNLTGLKNDREIVIKHFLDSLALAQFYDFNQKKSLIDIGTGAGFPGVPLRLCFPEIKLTLVESNQKKVRFLEYLVDNLFKNEADRPIIMAERAENLGSQPGWREKFDLSTGRAVGKFEKVVLWALPFLKIGGLFLAQLGPKEEFLKFQALVSALGAKIESSHHYILPFSDYQRVLVKLKKELSTPEISKSQLKKLLK